MRIEPRTERCMLQPVLHNCLAHLQVCEKCDCKPCPSLACLLPQRQGQTIWDSLNSFCPWFSQRRRIQQHNVAEFVCCHHCNVANSRLNFPTIAIRRPCTFHLWASRFAREVTLLHTVQRSKGSGKTRRICGQTCLCALTGGPVS